MELSVFSFDFLYGFFFCACLWELVNIWLDLVDDDDDDELYS